MKTKRLQAVSPEPFFTQEISRFLSLSAAIKRYKLQVVL